MRYPDKPKPHLLANLLAIFFVLQLAYCSQKAQPPVYQSFQYLNITCPSENQTSTIYYNGHVSKFWMDPRKHSFTCKPNSIVQDPPTADRKNFQLLNTFSNPKLKPITINKIIVSTDDPNVIDVTAPNTSFVLDRPVYYLFTVNTKCKNLSSVEQYWGLVNVTFISTATNESVSFYYQKLCRGDYQYRFDWSYVILVVVSIFIVGISSRAVTTFIQADEISVVHVFIFGCVTSSCYILLYYWAGYINTIVTIIFSIISFWATAFIFYTLWKSFINQGDCLMFKCKILCFGKVTFPKVFCLLVAAALVAAWYWKRNWIVGNALAILLLVALVKLAKIGSLKVGMALIVTVIGVYLLWTSVAAFLKHPVYGPAEALMKLPLNIVFPRLTLFPVKGSCNYISIIDCVFPGIFIAFCYRYDKAKGLKLFYLAAMVGFITGLILHAVLFYVSHVNVSPVFYLGPLTLAFVFIVACRRNEYKDIWEGLHSETEYIMHLLHKADDEDPKNPNVPEFDSKIFDTVDLKKQAEQMNPNWYPRGSNSSIDLNVSKTKTALLSKNDLSIRND